MTDAELEELERLLAGLEALLADQGARCRILLERYSRVFRVPSLLSTIRTLKAEVEKRDRVVEAARLKLAAEDKVNGNIAFGEHDEDAARANWRAWTNLAAALSALDQEDTP